MTLNEALRLARILDAAMHGWTVKRLFPADPDNFRPENTLEGTAQRVCAQYGGVAYNEDVLDLFLEVRSPWGKFYYWSIRELLADFDIDHFGIVL